MAGCLTACGSGLSSSLRMLRVLKGTPLCTTAWLPAMTALEYIDLNGCGQPLRLPCSSLRLKQLVAANFSGAPLHMPAALPTGVTHLGLHDMGSLDLPPQVCRSLLAALACIEPSQSTWTAGACANHHRFVSRWQSMPTAGLSHCSPHSSLPAWPLRFPISHRKLCADCCKGINALCSLCR